MSDVLHSLTDDSLTDAANGSVIGALGLLLRACADNGSIRPGVDPNDVLLMLGFLWRISPGEEGEARFAAARPGHRRAAARRTGGHSLEWRERGRRKLVR